MRIISGAYRGRELKTTRGPGYRPAMSKVRSALFSMLEARGIDWPACRVLDLFAGSGSLGFEALSRGAALVCFVESLPQAVSGIRQNAEMLGIDGRRCLILEEEAGRMLGRGSPLAYDLIFIDPPYGRNLFFSSLKAVLRRGWLKEGGFLNAELENGFKFDPGQADPLLALEADRHYGQTRLLLWIRKTPKSPSTPAPSTP
ncbi:MAG: 16S rRNA (guanine(966)-N(2))-methyltransferase RsmD [Desulfovibrionaceae bacterium]|nr:16S rRNA (guanine(966)-N(2))-methyltransferase RsmD [Desulfovibrionaceae bacterium]